MEEFLTLSEIQELLEKERKNRGELSSEQEFSAKHTETFCKLAAKDAEKLLKELKGLEFVSDFAAYKICDLMPNHPDDIRVIFAKERNTPGKEEVDQILQLVGKYL